MSSPVSAPAFDPVSRRRELAAFLKSKRAGITPRKDALSRGERRRTPGLRREEVAELSRISVTWYTWLEQAREIKPSPEALRRIGRVLRLNPTELEYVFRLAGVPMHHDSRAEESSVQAPVLRMVDGLRSPAVLLDERLVPIRWNEPFRDLILDLGSHAREGRNWMEILFCDPVVRERLLDWPVHFRRFVAEFRDIVGKRVGDPEVARLIADLESRCPEFASLWNSYEIPERRVELDFEVRHPREGRLRFERTAFMPVGSPGQRLIIFSRL